MCNKDNKNELALTKMVFDISREGFFDPLCSHVGLASANKLVSAVLEYANEFEDHGCQDSFRARIVGFLDSCSDDVAKTEGFIESVIKVNEFNNETEYNSLVTCCGSSDKFIVIDDILFEIGCNFGH
jgi:hypothetical protein